MTFNVGDICIIVHDLHGGVLTGRDCVITKPLSAMPILDPFGPGIIETPTYGLAVHGVSYTVRALPEELRLKRPPSKDDAEPRADFTPGDWSRCAWRPAKVAT